MPDIAKIDSVAMDSVAKVGGVAKASIGKMANADVAAGGASEWVTAYEDGGVGYAANSDLSSWTTYYSGASNESVDWQEVCYGADNNGSLGRYVFVWTRASSPGELRYTDDITNTSGFTGVNITPATGISAELYTVAYCNGVWLAAGKMSGNQGGHFYRSTDGGASWSGVNLSSLTGFGSTGIYSIAHDGASKVVITQDEHVFVSTDTGASWSVGLASLNTNAKGLFVLYSKTEEVFVVGYYKNGLKFRTCAASDLTTWAAQSSANDGSNNSIGVSSTAPRKSAAIAGSTFVVCNAQSHQRFTLSGQTITPDTFTSAQLPYANVKDVATDGTTWIAVHHGGDISKSTDDAATWSSAAANVAVASGADDDMKAVTCDVLQPV